MHRRRFLAGASMAVGSGVGGCLGSEPAQDTGDDEESPRDDGSGNDDPPPTPPTADELDPVDDADTDVNAPARWRLDVGDDATTRPLVVNGIVFAGGASGDVVAATEAGGILWRFEADERIRDPIAVAGDCLVAIAGANPMEGGDPVVHGIDIESGEGRWTVESPPGSYLELVAATEGEVFVATGNDGVAATGETMYALEGATGDERWTADVGTPSLTAAVDDDGVYLRSVDRLYAIDRDDGSERWHWDADRASMRPHVQDGVVFFASYVPGATTLLAFDALDGEERWRFEEWGVASITTGSDAVYVGGSEITAFDPATGDQLWEESGPSFLAGGPMVGETVYAGGDAVAGYDRSTGDEVMDFDPDREIVVAQDASEDVLAVDTSVSNDRGKVELFGVEPATGDLAWTFDREVELTDSRVGDQHVYVGTGDGYLYAVGR